MIISLSDSELKKCIEFSYECAKYQQEIEFGQSTTKPRSIEEIGRDNLIGKIAEVAFAKMIENKYGIIIELDFEYYPRGVWDKQDAEINGWRIDVKGTRQGGRWMLIEWSKLNFRQQEQRLSHMYVMASVKWNREAEVPTGKVDLVGSVSINRLRPNIGTTLILHKNELIPGTTTKLQADNYAINFNNLEHDWDKVINYIRNNPPPDLKDFKNPYDT